MARSGRDVPAPRWMPRTRHDVVLGRTRRGQRAKAQDLAFSTERVRLLDLTKPKMESENLSWPAVDDEAQKPVPLS